MLALRTSFIALLWDEKDPVLEVISISGGVDEFPNIPGTQFLTTHRSFTKGLTMSLTCWIWSKTEDDISENITATWQKSTDEGATWVNLDVTVSRISDYWSHYAFTTAARADFQYFDVRGLTLAGFIASDAGLYRLKATGGVIPTVYSANYARIRFAAG